ncbi:MAG: Mut7-C RNAse domain-containing protein [Alphaproteobacteria bacterium]
MTVRLLCDEMLVRLGRWLRAAGYDTLIAECASDDRILLETALADGRVLLTRDRNLASRANTPVRVIHMDSDGVPAQAQELKCRLNVCWQHDPFTRCVVDNTPLRAADVHEARKIPPNARALAGAVSACPTCGRL